MLVVTDSAAVARACAPVYAALPYMVDTMPSRGDLAAQVLMERAVISAVQQGLCSPGHEVVVIEVGLRWTGAARHTSTRGMARASHPATTWGCLRRLQQRPCSIH